MQVPVPPNGHWSKLQFGKSVEIIKLSQDYSGANEIKLYKLMWARVKGKTENDLMKLPFKSAYNFRPPFMLPTTGLKNTLPYYKYVTWIYPIARPLFPSYFITLQELGLAMINCALFGYEKNVLEALDIVALTKKNTR